MIFFSQNIWQFKNYSLSLPSLRLLHIYILTYKTEMIMNKIKVILVLMMVSLSLNMMAQNDYAAKKKQARAELKEKASKAARDEAKRLKKEGWTISPGALPLEVQLDRAYTYELDRDDNGDPVNIIGNGMSVGESYDAAKMQATELARVDIAGKIESETTMLVDNLVGNKQLPNEEAASVTTLLAEGKTIISQKLGRMQPVLECYRVNKKTKNKEVLVRLSTKESSVREVVKAYLREEMEKKGAKMSEQLDKLLKLDK